MQRQLLIFLTLGALFIGALALPPTTQAETRNCFWEDEVGFDYEPKFGEVLNRVACNAGLRTSWQTTDPVTEETFVGIIGNIITIVLGFTGVVFVVLTVYGGYLWMTARGNDEQVLQAQSYIRNSVIGIVIVFATFSISRFVIVNVVQVVGGTPGG